VFFNFGWVKYEERQNYLMESDAGIVTHPVHIETRFSFRTRTLDCMWASLPMISTEGDFFSDLIREKTLGIVVKEKDPEDIANAIIRLAENKEFYNKCVSNLKEIAKDYTWDKVCAPVLKYCMDPIKSSKRNNDSDNNENDNSASDRQRQSRGLLRKFFSHLVSSGPKKTFEYVKNYISKK
jgi:hypothetical protein